MINEKYYIKSLVSKGLDERIVESLIGCIGGFQNLLDDSKKASKFILVNEYSRRVDLEIEEPLTVSAPRALAETHIIKHISHKVGMKYIKKYKDILTQSLINYFEKTGKDKYIETIHLVHELPIGDIKDFYENNFNPSSENLIEPILKQEVCNQITIFTAYIMVYELNYLLGKLNPEELLSLDYSNINCVRTKGVNGKLSCNVAKDYGFEATSKLMKELNKYYHFSLSYDEDMSCIDYIDLSIKKDMISPPPVYLKLKNCGQVILEDSVIQYENINNFEKDDAIIMDIGPNSVFDAMIECNELKATVWEGTKCTFKGRVKNVDFELHEDVVFIGTGLKAHGIIMASNNNTVMLDCGNLFVSCSLNDNVNVVNNAECKDE